MYTDFKICNRDHWNFSYRGRELADGAKAKLGEISRAEKAARVTLVKLISDSSVSASDKNVQVAKSEIETLAEIREKLIVFVHEFERNPDEEYRLSIGDVVFFLQVDTSLKI